MPMPPIHIYISLSSSSNSLLIHTDACASSSSLFVFLSLNSFSWKEDRPHWPGRDVRWNVCKNAWTAKPQTSCCVVIKWLAGGMAEKSGQISTHAPLLLSFRPPAACRMSPGQLRTLCAALHCKIVIEWNTRGYARNSYSIFFSRPIKWRDNWRAGKLMQNDDCRRDVTTSIWDNSYYVIVHPYTVCSFSTCIGYLKKYLPTFFNFWRQNRQRK